MRKFKPALLALLFVIAATFPLVFSNPAVTTIAVFTMIYAASGTAWNIFSGYTGYIALGHAAFFGTGGYVLALICLHWNIPAGYEPFLFVPVAGLVAALVAIPVGLVSLRTRRHTFVVITIAIFFIFQLMAYNLRSLTGGSAGLSLPTVLWSGDFFNLPFYYAAFVVFLMALLVSWWVRSSKYGLTLLAIRDDEERARSLGVHADPSKLGAFVISALFVGMAGAIWAYFLEAIYPPFAFNPLFDVSLALMGFMGGMGTLSGPIIGALIIIPTEQYFALEYGTSGLYLIAYGALFLAVILLLPEGIVPTVSKRWAALKAQRAGTLTATASAEEPDAQQSVAVKSR